MSIKVFWSLLPSGEELWSYSPNPRHDLPFILVRERLFTIAAKLFWQQSSRVSVTFTGAEPVLHPYLNELINYIWDCSPACQIILEGGLEHIVTYKNNYCKDSDKEQLSFHIFLDARYANPEIYLIKLAELAESGYGVAVSMTNSESAQYDFLKTAARRLASSAPFTVHDTVEDIVSRHTTLLPTSHENIYYNDGASGFICGLGGNFIRIDPAGHIFGGICDFELAPKPLWKTEQTIRGALVRCSYEECNAARNWGTPRFKDVIQASSWLNSLNKQDVGMLAKGTAKLSEMPVSYEGIRNSQLASFAMALENLDETAAGKLYEEKREAIFAELKLAARDNALNEILEPALLARLGNSGAVVRALLGDSARLYCERNKIRLPIEPENWEYSDLSDYEWSEWEAEKFGFSSQQPLLSVIMPNFNKRGQITACLNSVLGQSFRNFELLIIDDCSTDGSYEILCDYARKDRRIRIWRCSRTVLPGNARNFGLERANGRFVIFVDSDDICLPGYFELAIDSIISSRADAVIFSSYMTDITGQTIWSNQPPRGTLNRSEALQAFFKGDFEPAPWAKIFDSDSIKFSSARFAQNVYHQDVPFFFSFLTSARKITVINKYVYENKEVAGSIMHPLAASTLRLHSACVFQKFYHDALEAVYGPYMKMPRKDIPLRHAMFNLEAVFLPNAGAWISSGANLPLTKMEAEMLAGSSVFMLCLLRSLAKSLVGDIQ